MKSYKKFKSKVDACQASTFQEKYEFMMSLLPYMKHYDTIKAQLEVLQMSPVEKAMEDLMKSGYGFYYGIIQSPYSVSKSASAIGIGLKIKEMPNGTAELLLDGKMAPQFFSDMDKVENDVKKDPEILAKEYKKLKKIVKESAQKISFLGETINVKDQLIESLKEHIDFLEENLPERGGEASK